MLIGGFQNIDLALLQKEPERETLPVRCDAGGLYNRQVCTNNGRTATVYLFEHCLRCQGEGHILLPDYLCLSVLVSVDAPGVKYRFYRVDKDLNIDLEDLMSKVDSGTKGIYLIHYFGVPHSEEAARALRALREERGIPIIEDITQALFSRDDQRMGYGDYLVCSTRKWMPMTDGGLLAARDGAPFPQTELVPGYNEAAYKQLLISLMRDYFTARPDEEMNYYLALEREANRTRYEDLRVYGMTDVSRRIMLGCDYQGLMESRLANYRYLYRRLEDNPHLRVLSGPPDVRGDHVPFGFVVLVEDRDGLYRYLAGQKRIIGEIQWELPFDRYTPGVDAAYLSAHNLMLHCDQRYGMEEMEAVATAVEEFFS